MTRTAIVYLPPLEAEAHVGEADISAGEGVAVVAVVRDERGASRGGLAQALEHIAAGEASTLVAPRLAMVASSLRELLALLDWLHAASADLIALDVSLDTATPAGQRIVRVLQEIERWEREPEPGRSPRGRPGLAIRAPELGERITAMRERGLSLRAIADTLNTDGVPTQRGGALWRPSSVQAALGYRRPRPPFPGAPPPPSRHPAGHPPAPPHPPHRGPRRP